MFNSVLINNRGEIACRIIKSCKKLGIKTIAVYSDIDEGARFTRLADIAVPLNGIDAADTYLNVEKIIAAAKHTGAEAIHPGYGFLSENPNFARACRENNIVFIGASPESIEAMGLKDSAKKIALEAGVPILPGFMGERQDLETLGNAAMEIGFPLLIKAIAGGGGRGIRQVEKLEDFKTLLESAKREAKSAFNDDRVMLEKLVLKPRHIEVQVFGDNHGNVVHLFERDCSVQRRRQKLIEEAPAPNLPDDVRAAMYNAAVKLASAVNYQGAGTIEFILDGSRPPSIDSFWFLEMNTRLQVEHPVTESITDLDLVEWQLRIAAGEKLPLSQNEIQMNGHAIEARIVAEDPNNNFMPSSGIYHRDEIIGYGDRIDEGFENGDFIPSNYDSLVEKIICWGYTRESAIDDLKSRILSANYRGFANNGGFVNRVLMLEDFQNSNLYTAIIDDNQEDLKRDSAKSPEKLAIAACAYYLFNPKAGVSSFTNFRSFRLNSAALCKMRLKTDEETFDIEMRDEGHEIAVRIHDLGETEIVKNNFSFNKEDETLHFRNDNLFSGNFISVKLSQYQISMFIDGERYEYQIPRFEGLENSIAHSDEIVANLPGKIVAINAVIGDKVEKGQIIIVLEAMKMEHSLCAQMDGELSELNAALHSQVKLGEVLAKLK